MEFKNYFMKDNGRFANLQTLIKYPSNGLPNMEHFNVKFNTISIFIDVSTKIYCTLVAIYIHRQDWFCHKGVNIYPQI